MQHHGVYMPEPVAAGCFFYTAGTGKTFQILDEKVFFKTACWEET